MNSRLSMTTRSGCGPPILGGSGQCVNRHLPQAAPHAATPVTVSIRSWSTRSAGDCGATDSPFARKYRVHFAAQTRGIAVDGSDIVPRQRAAFGDRARELDAVGKAERQGAPRERNPRRPPLV